MRVKLCYYILFLFLFSCSQIDFVLSDGEEQNPLKQKTSLKVVNGSSSIFVERLVYFFGENINPKFDLIINASEKTTNRFVEKDQVASKIDYEIKISYKLLNKVDSCIILETTKSSQFSFTPKSSGYNFGSDSSLGNLYKRVFDRNIEGFLSDAKNNIKSSRCAIEN